MPVTPTYGPAAHAYGRCSELSIAAAICVAACEGEVVFEVAGGFGWGHRVQGVAQCDALVEGGEDAESDLAAEGGLADE